MQRFLLRVDWLRGDNCMHEKEENGGQIGPKNASVTRLSKAEVRVHVHDQGSHVPRDTPLLLFTSSTPPTFPVSLKLSLHVRCQIPGLPQVCLPLMIPASEWRPFHHPP